jgi:nitrile hydratase
MGGGVVSSSSHTAPPSDPALRVKAIESILVEKGIVDSDAMDEVIDIYEHRIGPHNGAKVVARAWTDPEFKTRLLANGSSAIAELGFSGAQGEDMVVLENTPAIHNVVVCTLCSCYPWPVLGLPPVWYKSAPYRSRIVLEPRAVLAEFGVTIAPEVEVRVWDSTAELRYLVLPMRPSGVEGFDEASLADLVTRDSMIGTGLPRSLAQAKKRAAE